MQAWWGKTAALLGGTSVLSILEGQIEGPLSCPLTPPPSPYPHCLARYRSGSASLQHAVHKYASTQRSSCVTRVHTMRSIHAVDAVHSVHAVRVMHGMHQCGSAQCKSAHALCTYAQLHERHVPAHCNDDEVCKALFQISATYLTSNWI